MTADLSILVCSIVSRQSYLTHLLDQCLTKQLTDRVELIVDTDDGDVSIGAKRQRMLATSTGRYVCWIDDDDTVPDDYVAKLLAAIDLSPDCVGFKVGRYVDGEWQGESIHAIENPEFDDKTIDGIRTFYRPINHLNPVRRELALQVGFLSVNWAEDKDYAMRLKPLLNTTVFIPHILYNYFYRRPHLRPGEKVNG